MSVVGVVGVPIAFVGVGERPQDFEPFHARTGSCRGCCVGDILTLIERAEGRSTMSREKLETKTRLDDFTLEDFEDQLRTIKKMGPLDQVLGMIPGMGAIKALTLSAPRWMASRWSACRRSSSSMTIEERRNHQLINGGRRKRGARRARRWKK